MLYLEASGLEGIVPLDSVKLKGEGTFKFKQPRPESPEFYRLRVDNKVINFSVDSIETLQINAPYVDFSTAYTVEGSENSSKIKELTLKQIDLQKNVDDLLATLRNNNISHDIFEDSLATLLNNYNNLKNLPPLAPGDVLLHGHTHIPAWTEFGEGNLYLNPGSVSIPKEGSAHSYMTLEGETFLWKTLEGEVYRELEL